ncbi:hypothetical protein [Peribacillus asahii]|uniref:hypothetical protein n=1 Tax=Peribacillus asahii TaxID=228899 RepID=UPI0038168AD2
MKKLIYLLALSLALVGCSNEIERVAQKTTTSEPKEEVVKENSEKQKTHFSEEETVNTKEQKSIEPETKRIAYWFKTDKKMRSFTKATGDGFDIWLLRRFEFIDGKLYASGYEKNMYMEVKKLPNDVDIEQLKMDDIGAFGEEGKPIEKSITENERRRLYQPIYTIMSLNSDTTDFQHRSLYEIDGVKYSVVFFHKDRFPMGNEQRGTIPYDFFEYARIMLDTIETK